MVPFDTFRPHRQRPGGYFRGMRSFAVSSLAVFFYDSFKCPLTNAFRGTVGALALHCDVPKGTIPVDRDGDERGSWEARLCEAKFCTDGQEEKKFHWAEFRWGELHWGEVLMG